MPANLRRQQQVLAIMDRVGTKPSAEDLEAIDELHALIGGN